MWLYIDEFAWAFRQLYQLLMKLLGIGQLELELPVHATLMRQ